MQEKSHPVQVKQCSSQDLRAGGCRVVHFFVVIQEGHHKSCDGLSIKTCYKI